MFKLKIIFIALICVSALISTIYFGVQWYNFKSDERLLLMPPEPIIGSLFSFVVFILSLDKLYLLL